MLGLALTVAGERKWDRRMARAAVLLALEQLPATRHLPHEPQVPYFKRVGEDDFFKGLYQRMQYRRECRVCGDSELTSISLRIASER
jgi:hypothetical protein